MTQDQASYSAYKKQLRGWLSYAFASEVFVIVSLTLFLPICLEQFARDNGYLLPERTEPCSSMSKNARSPSSEDQRCVVKLAWLWIDSASFSLYVYSISVALQALTVISMGGIADHRRHRKPLLLGFAFLGGLAASFFLVLQSSSPVWPLAALLAMCANVGFGASVVAMNAYLPSLARESPEVVKVLQEIQCEEESQGDAQISNEEEAHAPLISQGSQISSPSQRLRYDTALSAATSRISSLGIALGYGAGILLLLVALIAVTLLHGSTFSLRLAIGLSGIWWVFFSIPAALWLPSESKVSQRLDEWLDEDEAVGIPGDEHSWDVWREIRASWVRLGGMLQWRQIKRLRSTFRYLGAWFLLSDGFTTITSTAILFGKTTLHMTPSSLILVGVLTPTAGISGALLWPVLQRRYQWSNLRILVTLVIMASLVPAYGCLGFLSIMQGRGGLTTPVELLVLAVYFGFVYGAFQSYARAFYAELLPPGEEARWYGLFSITDKSSSFIGPLVVGIIADTTGNIRYAFFFLTLMIWLAVPVLAGVNVERGRRDAREYKYEAHQP